MHKQQGSTIIMAVIVLSLIAVVGLYWGYSAYQHHQQAKQQQLQQLIAEQQTIISQQRAAHGDLPEKILVEPVARSTPTPQVKATNQPLHAAKDFQCDGREHCSQMRSYEEAVFFNQYCPNTKMDGDGDGIPCEQQFKGGL